MDNKNSIVNWRDIISNDAFATIAYASGNMTFRQFERSLTGSAREEAKKLTTRKPDYRRTLARKAVRRRSKTLTVTL